MHLGSGFRHAQTAIINSLLLKRDLFAFLETIAATREPLSQINLSGGRFWLANRVDAIREVLSADEQMIGKPAFLAQSHRGGHGDGLASLGGTDWEQRRRLVSRALTPALYARVASEARAATVAAMAELPQGVAVNFAQLLSTLVTRIGARWILSAEVGDSAQLNAIPWPEAEGVRFSADLSGVAADLMPSQRLRAGTVPVLRGIIRAKWQSPHDGADFISALRAACATEQGTLGEADVFDEIVQLLFASHHSITTTLVHCIDFLHRHPALAAAVVNCARLNAGQDKLAGERKYTEHFIKEVMRFCMPTPLLFREAMAAQTIAGHAIARGDLLAISPYLLHRSAEYFPHPLHFDPSRFGAAISAYAYLPFGAGPRRCNFHRLAMMQMQVIVETLVLSGRFVPVQQAARNRFAISYPGPAYPVRFERGEG